MEHYIAMLSNLSFLFATLILSSIIFTKILKPRLSLPNSLPPGSLGWPLIGESLDFMKFNKAGRPENFTRDRINKYNSQVLKTSILGESFIVLSGQAAHKLLFSNENKLVQVWWPSSVKKLLKSSLSNLVGDEGKRVRKMLMTFLNLDYLKKYVERMDLAAQHHINTYWQGKEEVKVYDTVKYYTFQLACQLFASINDPVQISKIAPPFDIFVKAVIGFPINIPGTKFYRAMKAADAIRKELGLIIRQRREELEKKMVLPTQDLLSHLLVTADANGKFLTEAEIVDNILLLLYAGFDTTRSTTTLVFKYLARLPHVFEKVLQEQIQIAESKREEELLTWEDVQKMKFTWNTVCEVLRMSPPVGGGFREAIVDFTYAGYTIPKGWKILFSSGLTHKDSSLYPEPQKFDASRFEGDGPLPYSFVPFGGGPRMCPGNELARLQLLVFLHNIVKRFKWELVNPDEHFAYDPMLSPSHGLPVRLQSL